ncbi:uncharacterized protein Fot_40191 [Forsythia ovata]|uniref:Uncharacterized protein n=1 Tax=Forsythia ovata TaxID=205694 RepID=A0ABD1SAD5_9LAMI
MNLIDESLEPFSSKDENLEPGELLEESWFFGNLLDRKKTMLRSYSDPCTSSNRSHEILSEKSYEETYESIKKLSKGTEFDGTNLMRTPSVPENGSDYQTKRSNGRGKYIDLLRAPSLPTCLGEDEFQDDESEFSMGKLIRQASLNHSDRGTSTKPAPKGMTQRYSIPRHSPQRKPDIETINMEGCSEMKPKYLIDQTRKMQKSFSDLKIEDIRSFKNSGLSYNKRGSNTNAVSPFPGLEEKTPLEEYEEKNTRRTPYFSEAWRGQSSAPPIPKWAGKRSNEDMKAQIKFWARAVASNVRQEC